MRRIRKKWIYAGAAVIAVSGLCSLIDHQSELNEVLQLPVTRCEEYEIALSDEPEETLQDWQKINSDVRYVLEFSEANRQCRIPVLAASDPDYAMRHNLYGEYDTMGSVFVEDTGTEIDTADNLIIYGHSSKTKDWCFTFLKQYSDPDYFQDHPLIILEGTDARETYEVVSFGRYDLNEEDTWLGWGSPSLGSIEEAREMFLQSEPYLIQKRRGIAYHGQRVLTLVTCDMAQEDSRYVLQAVRKVFL